MSFFPGKDPSLGDAPSSDAIEQVIVPRSVDLGGFQVHRALPSGRSRMVGPFIFFDHFGPAVFKAGDGVDVRPHPHIGLATVTYLFDGEIVHRDSLGTAMPIRPGAVNWMTAGRGIVHSERTAADHRDGGEPLHGLQLWVALPMQDEETAPAFAHTAAADIPALSENGLALRVVAGTLHGLRSPVVTSWDTLFADAHLNAGATLPLDAAHEERAVYVLGGEIEIGGDRHRAGAAAGAQAGRSGGDPGGERCPLRHGRRRRHGRAAPHLVEFRLLAQGTHRGRQSRLEGRPLRYRAGRHDGIHSTAGLDQEAAMPRRAALLIGTLCALAAAAPAQAQSDLAHAYRIIAAKTFVDLTHSFGPETPVWSGFGQAKFSPAADPKTHEPYTIAKDGFRTTYYEMVGQYGTHVDPPAHFAENGITMDQIPLKQMILPLVVLDDTPYLGKDPNHAFSVADLKAWERSARPRAEGCLRGAAHRHVQGLGLQTPSASSASRFRPGPSRPSNISTNSAA